MPRFLLRFNALKHILKNKQIANTKSLEIGFGSGEILKYMAKEGADVTGYDFSRQAIEMATERISQTKYVKNISITNDESVLIKGHYDFVFAFEVLEHIEADEQALNQWLGYLKPGGSLIISVPAHMSKWCKNDVWAGHIRRYEKQQLISMCEGKNLTIKQLWNYGYPLTIALDKLLDMSKKNIQLQSNNSTQEKIKLTKNSGVDRDNKLIYRMISNDWVLYPFYLLQRLFFNRDMGSGYILHVVVNEK